MFCSNCGNQVAEGAAFCANCGTALKAQTAPVAVPVAEPVAAPVETPAPVAEPVAVATPVAEPVAAPVEQQTFAPAPQTDNVYSAPSYGAAPAFNAATVEAGPSSTSIMVKGIVAIACAWFPWICVLGIVFGVLSRNGASQFMAANGGQIFGKAKVGSILGRVGFVGGIVMTAIYGIILLASVAA